MIHYTLTLLDTANPFWDPYIIDFINQIKAAMVKMSLVTIAKEIAAALALIYISVRAYSMIAGDGRLDVMALFRPFIINLVILNMGTFTDVLTYPGTQAEKIMSTSFDQNAAIINDLEDQRNSEYYKIRQRVYDIGDSSKSLLHAANEGDLFSSIENAVTDLGINLTLYAQVSMLEIQMMLTQVITNVVVGLFKGVAYSLFFISAIIMIILTLLGPIAMALSIAGAFKDSWVHWAGKVIAVSFYNAIGFVTLNVSCAILNYGFQQEIDRLGQILNIGPQADFLAQVLHIDGYFVYFFIAIVVAIAGVASTPLVSTWFISTSGAGGFAGSVARAPASIMKSVKGFAS